MIEGLDLYPNELSDPRQPGSGVKVDSVRLPFAAVFLHRRMEVARVRSFLYSSYDGHAETVKGTVIEGLDLWVSKNEHQRVLWPSIIKFSQCYFESLLAHAVPLNEAAVSRLSHSAMGLDVYTWLAQRELPLIGVEKEKGRP